MITIEQLLESVDLDFEPRWVAQDKDGVTIFADKPNDCENAEQWFATNPTSGFAEYDGLKLVEFESKDWTECIYEVPRKTAGKIKKLECYELVDKEFNPTGKFEPMCFMTLIETINSLVDAVNELKGVKNE